MVPSSSRLSPLAKPFSLKKGHDQEQDHQQPVRMDASSFPEGNWMSYSGFSGLPSVPSLDLDNYLKKEADDKGSGIRIRSCEKEIVSASLIGSQPYSSVVARILNEYELDKVAKESGLFNGDQKMISSGSNCGFHSPDDSGWGLQKDESSIGRQDGFLFKGKDAINSPAFHIDMKKGHQASKLSRLLDETCNSVNAVVQMKFTGAEHEHEQGNAKLPRRAYDVAFPFEDLVALDWDYSVMPKGDLVNTFGGQSPTLTADQDCQSSVSCQSWINQLVSSPIKNVVPPLQNIDHLQTQAYSQTRSNMDSIIVGVATSSPPIMDSLPAVKCHAQLIETSFVCLDSEKEAEGIETVGDLAPHLGRVKLGHKEIEKDDSDVDSPCWKGLSSHQSHLGASGASDARHPATNLVAKNSLNPLAPQFFPQNAKSWSSYEECKFVTEDLFSFARTTAPPTEALPETLDLDEDFCPPVKYGPLRHPAHSDMSDHGNKPLQKGDEKFNFCLDQPLTEENYFRFTRETEMLAGFTGQENDMDGPADKKTISVPLLAVPNDAGTLSQQENSVPVLTNPTVTGNTSFGASVAIKMSLNVDEEVLVDTMHDLSKLLLTKCHGECSFDKLNHERIQTVIHNLLICVGGVHAKRDSMHELANHCISEKPCKYTDFLTLQENDSLMLKKGSHEASGSSSGAPIRIHQTSEKTQRAVCFNDAKISRQAELYQTLWLETQAELCSLKSKITTSHMKL